MLLQDSTDFIHQTTVTLMHGINMTQVWPLQLENSSSSSVPVNIYDCNLKTPLGCSGTTATGLSLHLNQTHFYDIFAPALHNSTY